MLNLEGLEEKQPKEKTIRKKKVSKPVMPKLFEFGEVIMPASMLNDKESFLKLWVGKLKNTDINKAWKSAEQFVEKYK